MDKIDFVNGEAPYINAKNLNGIQNNIENMFKAIGLGGDLVNIKNQELNDINTSCFRYCNTCTVNNVNISNGYLLTLVLSSSYRVQFYISAYQDGALQYRKLINGSWTNFTNV